MEAAQWQRVSCNTMELVVIGRRRLFVLRVKRGKGRELKEEGNREARGTEEGGLDFEVPSEP